MLLASGNYTRTNNSNNGVRINIPDSQTVNLLKDTGGGTWTGPGNVVAPTALNIVDAVSFATLPQNQQFTVKAGEGDVNLNGEVDFADLIAVASNFGKSERPRAYGLVAAAGAIAAALGPLIGGFFTTYASWRWVFAGEVLIVAVILLLARRVNDTPAEEGVKLDLFGTFLSALGLGVVVFGILKAGTWGVV